MNPVRILVLALASVVLAAPHAPAAAVGNVTIEGFTFTPPVVLTSDDNVTFTNLDPFAHEPHADDGCFAPAFISGAPAGRTVSRTVDLTGCPDEIPYHCHIHTFMTGTILRA